MSDSIHDSLDAYMIGGLDRSERAAFERHLNFCDACREARDSFRDVLDALADIDIPTPPPVPGVAKRSATRAISPQGIVSVLAVAASLSMFTSFALPRYERAIHAERAYAQIARMLATDPVEVALVGPHGVTGRAIVGDGHRNSGFIVRGLPDAGPGLVYRVWLRGTSLRKAAGVLERTPDGLHVLVTPGDAFVRAAEIHVMLEPTTESVGSTRSLVLSGTIG